MTRPCKIWKRTVAEPGTGSDALQYGLTIAELESQGLRARKRARKAGHLPVWGDAPWDSRVEKSRDGSWDLVEARASVAAIQDEQEDTEIPTTSHRQGTFPEEKLRWVPRKRHNSRWPIEPSTRAHTTLMAELQPLVEFEIPSASIDTAAAQHSPQRATDKQMRRRSTRRLSRRVSFAHIEDLSISQSPIPRRMSQVAASPMKSSPTKRVSTSPQKSFTLLATPAKVLFRASPAKGRSPALQRSPTQPGQLSPPTPVVEAYEVEDDSSRLSESSVLVFEQPLPEAQAEPAHETRRRVSLQNAMRLDRRSFGGRRSLDFVHAQQSVPNRRHSFMPQSSAASFESKSRRHTLDVFGQSSTVATEMEQDEETTTGFSSAETTENISEVVVDVCANLDIFGQKSGVTRRRKARRSTAQQEPMPDVGHSKEGASSPQSASSRNSQEVDDSPLPIGLGITHNADGALESPDQAAVLETSFSMPAEDDDEADTPNKDFWLDDGIGSTPYDRSNKVTRDDEVQQEDMFAPHDPEGLSTIFEDEETSFVQSTPPQHAVDHVADAYSPTLPSTKEDSISAETSSPSPTTAAELDEHTAHFAAPESSPESPEPEEQSGPTHDETMQQSFDFTMDADEAVQRTPIVEADATLVTKHSESSPAEKLPTSLSSIASPREEESEQEREQEQSDCYPSPPHDNSVTLAEDDDFCGTLVVEDFPDPAEATPTQSEADDKDDGSEHGDAATMNTPSPLSRVEVASSPAANVEEMDALSSTPSQAARVSGDAAEYVETVLDTPPSKGKGFTPINADRVSPPVQQSPSVKDADEDEQEEADDLQDEDMALAMDYEPTLPINLDDETVTVEAPETDAEPAALQEDSETEMLRKFVTRVSANKAAAALARRNLRPKRRSGSTGSATSVTGSPASKSCSSLSAEAAQKMMSASMAASPAQARRPLGDKDANSPSPTKKRKVSGGSGKNAGKTHSDDLFRGNPALYSAEISPPKSKRLRSRRRVEAESDTGDFANSNQAPEPQTQSQDSSTSADPASSGAAAPRRSTRSRNSRVQLKPPAPSANSIALSLIPVRLPGSSGMMLTQADTSADKDMPAPVVVPRAARTTAEEKDLAAVTRVNTRKNKGGAMPPKIVLSRQAEDPLGYKLKELKGVFDAKEGRELEVEGGDEAEKDGRKSRKGKGVRWATELVRFNTDFEATSPRVAAVPGPLVPVRKGARVAPAEEKVDEEVSTGGEQSASAAVEEKEEQQVQEEKPEEKENRPAPTRRTRQSRLQMPTPISKKILAESGTTAPAAAAPKAASASLVKMATRRTKIASLGMGVNGTPAPKRRTRA